MQDFPKFDESDYRKTRRQIHSIAGILGKFREVLVEPIAKNDNLWLSVVDKGFCTPPMSKLCDLEIGFSLEELVIEIGDNKERFASVIINGNSASDLCSKIKKILREKFEIDARIGPQEFDSPQIFEIESRNSSDFLTQFTNFDVLLNDFRKRIPAGDGVKAQICLWPHHFDNAFKWFSGKKIDDVYEQMGIGVSNGDEMNELPYIYMTIYPELRKMNTLEIPEGAHLHDTGWQGLILTYDAITEKKTAEEQRASVNNFLDVGFKGIKRGFSKR